MAIWCYCAMTRDHTFSIVIITVCRNEYSFQWCIIWYRMTACWKKNSSYLDVTELILTGVFGTFKSK